MKYIKEYRLYEMELGWKEEVYFPDLGSFEAKLDTGNGTKASSLGVDSLVIKGDQVQWSCRGRDRLDPIMDWSSAEVGDSIDRRPVIFLSLEIGDTRLDRVPIALTDRSGKETPVLLNRDILSQLGVTVAPGLEFVLGESEDLAQARRLVDLGLASEEDFKQTARDLGYVERNRTGFMEAFKGLFADLGIEMHNTATDRQARNGTSVIRMSSADVAKILFTVPTPRGLSDHRARRWDRIIAKLRSFQREMEMETDWLPGSRGAFEYWIFPGSIRGAGRIGEPTSSPTILFDGTKTPDELLAQWLYRVALDAEARSWRWDRGSQHYQYRNLRPF